SWRSSAAPSVVGTASILPSALLRCFGAVVLGDFAADDLAVERQRLQHDVKAVAVLVREGEADVEPIVVLAFAPDNRVDAMRRFGCLFLRHWNSPCRAVAMSCVSRRQTMP